MKSTITLRRGATKIEINAPQYGYTTRVRMALEISARADGKTGRFDNGREYDTRYCDADFSLTETQAGLLWDFLRNDARGEAFQILAHEHINPFGPDLAGGDRRFMARNLTPDLGNAVESPWLFFPARLTFAMQSAPPCVLPAKREQGGNIEIAGVSGFRQPADWPDTETAYGVITVIGRGGGGASEDATDDADSWTAKISATCNESMAARLVHQLTQITRGKTFDIVTAQGIYLFGRDMQSSGTYSVELSDPEIAITHNMLDRYTVVFSVRLKSTTSISVSSYSNSRSSSSVPSVSRSSSSDSKSSYSNSSSSDSVSVDPTSVSISVSSSSDSVSVWNSVSWWVPPY